MGTRAGVYTRLSRFKTTEELTSLGMERQSEDALRLAAERGYQVVKHYADPGLSAADDVVREQFEQALADLREGVIDVLVIPRFDRMTRGLATWLRVERILLDTGRKIVSVTDGDLDPNDPAGKFMLRQRAQMAEYELNSIKARVRRWHRQRAYAGKPNVAGARPFGYATKDRSQIDRDEAQVITWAARELLNGASLRRVVAQVNAKGMTTPTGKPWRVGDFRRMLLSPGVAGLRFHQGTKAAAGTWPAILDEATWTKLVERFTMTKREGRPPMHLLSGLLRCGRCGHPMHSTRSPRGVRQYACRTRPGAPNCGKCSVYAEPVEELVAERVLDRIAPEHLASALAGLGDGQADTAARELIEAEQAREEIEQMFTSGAIRREAFLRMHKPAEDRVEQARRALLAATSRSALSGLPTDPEELRAWWHDPATTTDERREVLAAVLERVVIQPPTSAARVFGPERVQTPKEAWRV